MAYYCVTRATRNDRVVEALNLWPSDKVGLVKLKCLANNITFIYHFPPP